MKIKPILANMSGRLQGIVASHNRGGQYFRGRTVPITPPTPDQTGMRVIMTTCIFHWTNTLTEVQREAWNAYAIANPSVDGFGDSVNAGGVGWYVKTNSGRLQAGLARIDAAPTINGPAALTLPTFANSTGDLEVTFEPADPWTGAGGALVLFASRPQSITKISASGISLRFMGNIPGDAVPPTSPQVITLPTGFELVAGQRSFVRAVALDTDGRRSAAYHTFLVP